MLIEMHAHVIYGVDDGPKDQEAMIRMLSSASKNGTERLYCTSHYTFGNNEYPIELYREHLEEARNWCKENAPGLELYSGAEIYVSEEILSMPFPQNLPTMQGTNLALLEFPLNISLRDVIRIIEKFQSNGYRLILAHVERYSALRSAKTIQKLKEEYDIQIQVNSQSIFNENSGFFHKRRIGKLLQMDLIDYISSDAHNTTSRPFCLEYAYHWLCTNGFEELADPLCGGNMKRNG